MLLYIKKTLFWQQGDAALEFPSPQSATAMALGAESELTFPWAQMLLSPLPCHPGCPDLLQKYALLQDNYFDTFLDLVVLN